MVGQEKPTPFLGVALGLLVLAGARRKKIKTGACSP
jgi:hypothetical protein